MKHFLAVLFCSTVLFSQTPLNKISARLSEKLQRFSAVPVPVWVFFTNKTANLDYYNQHPELLLSQKAIARRKKVFPSNALLESTDLPVSQEYINSLKETGMVVRHVSKYFNAVSGFISQHQLSAIASLPSVSELDIVEQLSAARKVHDETLGNPSTVQQPSGTFALSYGNSLSQNQQINVPAVHNTGNYGQGVYVAVFDAGFNRLSHESFSTMQIIAKWDFVNNDPDVGDGTDMGSGTHGTQTLSTVGGYKSGSLIGPAFGATFMLAKTENTDSETPIEEDNWIRAVEWADSLGADIITSSLGYIGFDAPYISYTWQNMDGNFCRITRGADLAVKKGMVVCNSAGNEGTHATHNTLGAPSDGDSVIAVGAVGASGNRSSFSSVGNTIDGRIKPDVSAMGSSVAVASTSSNTGYTYNSGTSFSCPLAAGVAALVLSARPNLTPMQVRDAMRNTASLASTPNRELGWGILNALNAINYFPLPVELVSFTAQRTSIGTYLRWKTATELNNKGFTVERSVNNAQWLPVAFVEGNGTVTTPREYSFSDNFAASGKILYRLKQTDFDGSFEYSATIEVDNLEPIDFTVSRNFPNPFNPSTNFTVDIALPAQTDIVVANALGQVVAVLHNGVLQSGTHTFTWNADAFSAGLYFLSVRSSGKSVTHKMSLLK